MYMMESYGFMVIVLVAFVVVDLRIGSLTCIFLQYIHMYMYTHTYSEKQLLEQ